MELKDVFESIGLTAWRGPVKKLESTRGLVISGFAAELGREPELEPGVALGWKVFAAGLGLNSLARTLNLLDKLDEGVCMPLEGCEGPVGGMRISGAGTGCGTPPLKGIFPCCLSCC